MSAYSSLRYEDWLRGWREWARTRKRGKMAQFIVEKLEEGNQAQWLSIERGLFELTEWHAIAKEWFGEKPRNSEEVDAPCMLRKGLPRAFPGLEEVKEKSRKEGTQYRSRVFKAPQTLMNDVLLHITNTPGAYIQNGGTADHVPFYPNTYFGNTTSSDNTGNPVTSSSPYFSLNHQLMGTGTGAPPEFSNSPTATSSVHGDIHHTNSHNHDYHHHQPQQQQQPAHQQFVTHPDGHDYFQQQRTTSYTNEEIDMYVQRITENGVNGGSSSSTGVGHPPSNSSSNGLFSPPTSVGMLGVPSPSYQLKEEMGSPPSGPPPYGTSPASTHSPRISPEPSMLGSYPPSVQQQQSNIVTGSEMSPGTCSSTSPAVPVEPEMMKVKVNPNSSPLEGGGQMVLLFYNPLPLGNKVVAFCSQKNHDLAYAQEAFQENMMALICQIPEFPYPEEVELRVYNYNQIIARTTFVFYQRTIQMPPPSDMILQILSSQLQSHFPGSNNGGNAAANGASNGDQMSGGGYGYIPNSMYQLLLGACRLGCEPLVHCLLSSPVMEELSLDQMKEAYQCANSNGHESLSDLLMELVVLHDMTPTAARMPQYISRGIGNNPVEQKKHVPAYYSVVDELHQGGGTPQARAETVLKQLLEAMKICKDQSTKNEDEIAITEKNPPVNDKVGKEGETLQGNVGGNNSKDEGITTPIIEITPNLSSNVNELAVQMEQTSLAGPPPPRRRLSSSAKLTRQSNSISDEDDEIRHNETSLKSPAVMHSRESWAEVDDIVPDLVSRKTKHPYTQQSDADSAIGGMSFDEDINSMINPEAQRRRSSMLLPSDGFSQSDVVQLKLNSDQGLEIANSLEYEGHIIVTEDYPSDPDKKIFCKGDRILQVGDRSIRGMSAVDFSEFFQSEASAGTIVKVIPAPTSPGSMSETSSSTSQQKSLKRTFSEQCPPDAVKSKINQFLSSKSFGTDRKVTLSRSGNGYPIKMIGGKMVGIFVSDGDVTHIFPGDEILELNGISTRGMSLYDANHIVQSSVGELNLLVAENRNKYSHVRELIEVDSIYLRSLVELKSTTSRDMTLQKGTLLRVVNIYGLPNYWVAWCIDETTGLETQLKRIPPPSIAKRQFNCDAYERLERHDSTFPRPLCISGPNSDKVAQLIADKPQFNLCSSVVDILGVCSKGSRHAVMSVTEPEQLAMLNILQPIVLQTPSDDAILSEQAKYTKFPVNSYLNGTSCSDMAEQAVEELESLQSLPIWKSIGVI